MKSSDHIIHAIIAVAAIQMGTNAISPIMADLSAAFPSASPSTIQFLMTCPSIMVILFGLATGVLSRTVSRRFLSSLGCALFALSGILSWRFHGSLPALFAWAIMMGSGIGIAVPIALGSVNEYVARDRQQSVMGWIIAASNLGAMIMTFTGGLLAGIHWSCDYLVYLIALPGMILTLMFYPTQKASAASDRVEYSDASPSKTAAGTSGGIAEVLKSPGVLAACGIAFLSTLLFNIIPANLSMLLAEKSIGTSLQAGTGTTLMLLTGTLIGLAYGRLEKRLGSRCMVFAFFMIFAGQLLCAKAVSMWMIYLGCLIAGMSQSVNMAYALMMAANYAKGNSTLSASLVTSMSHLGAFGAPLITILASVGNTAEPVSARLLISAAIAAAASIAIFLFTFRGIHGARNRDQRH